MSNQPRVLVIEDEPSLVEALEQELRHGGCEVFTAQNGVAGMEMALQYQPDLIVLDLLLPRLGGLEMLEKIRTYDWGKAATVVVLTNFDEPSLIARANELGVTDYLVKANYKLADIVSVVRRRLDSLT